MGMEALQKTNKMKTHQIKSPNFQYFIDTWSSDQPAKGVICTTVDDIINRKNIPILSGLVEAGEILKIQLDDHTAQTRVPCTVTYTYEIMEYDKVSVLAYFKSRTVKFKDDA